MKPGPKPRFRKCEFEGCGKPHDSHGLCSSHANQLRRGIPLRPVRKKTWTNTECRCGRPATVMGLCQTHYSLSLKGVPFRELRDVRPAGATLLRDEQGRKECKKCGEWLPESAYYTSSKTQDGLAVRCKECVKWRTTLGNLNVTPEQYAEMLAAQGGACAICHKTNPNGWRLSIDHDHACCPTPGRSCGNCVRGLLCAACNMGLGHFRDHPELLISAAIYLEAVSA